MALDSAPEPATDTRVPPAGSWSARPVRTAGS
jgi:hypothetical protein